MYLNRRLVAVVAAVAAVLSVAQPAIADTLTIPNTFTPGTAILSTQVNGNFSAISGWSTNITNSNIKVGAAIAPSKLDFTAQIGPILRTAASQCFSAGTTGDTQPRFAVFSEGTIKFGAGGASAQDMMLKRKDANTLSVRDAGDTTNKNLEAGNISASGTLTVTGAASAASLALTGGATMGTPLPATSGGTGLSGLGSANQLLGMDAGGVALTYVTPTALGLGIGGSGSDGAVADATGSASGTYYTKSATTYTHTAGSIAVQAITVYATSTLNQAALMNTNGLGNVGATTTSTASKDGYVGRGLYGGGGGGTTNISGGGGAGSPSGNNGAQAGGSTGPDGMPGGNGVNFYIGAFSGSLAGSGGGSGGSGASGTGGAGGNGGGIVRLCSNGAMTLGTGTMITCNGTAGSNATVLGGGGGGGSGGSILLYSLVGITGSTTTITCTGGAGGNGAGAGGDGGGGACGGMIVAVCPLASSTFAGGATISTSVTGGSGGTGTIAGGSSGGGVTIILTGTPSLPLLAYHADGRGLRNYCAMLKATRGGDRFDLDVREQNSYLAALYAKPGKFDDLRFALMHGGGAETAELSCVDVKPAFIETHADAIKLNAGVIERTAVNVDVEAMADRT